MARRSTPKVKKRTPLYEQVEETQEISRRRRKHRKHHQTIHRAAQIGADLVDIVFDFRDLLRGL